MGNSECGAIPGNARDLDVCSSIRQGRDRRTLVSCPLVHADGRIVRLSWLAQDTHGKFVRFSFLMQDAEEKIVHAFFLMQDTEEKIVEDRLSSGSSRVATVHDGNKIVMEKVSCVLAEACVVDEKIFRMHD